MITRLPFPRHRFTLVFASTVALLLTLSGCGGGGGGAVTTGSAGGNELPGSGINGTTRAYPSMPTQTVGQTDPGIAVPGATVSVRNCDTVSTTTANTCAIVGVEVARTTSDSNANFSVAVNPGRYVLVGIPPVNSGPFPSFRANNTLVTVTSGQFTTASVVFDSGIR